jgi:hypothetical protein
MVEVRVINKSRVTEEDVSVALAPGRRYEIVASTDSSPVLSHEAIKIPRIPPGDDFSVLLMVEGGEFTKNEISTVSSKMTMGKVLDGLEQVPPNAGNFLLGITAILLVAGTPIAGLEYYDTWKKEGEAKVRSERLAALDFLKEKGWSSLERYSDSIYRDNYKSSEFPIFQKAVSRRGNVVSVTFGVINKAAAVLSLGVMADWPYKDNDPKPWENSNKYSHLVEPGGVYELTVKMYWPKGKAGSAEVTFNLSSGEDNYITVIKAVDIGV